jgi:GNAT superfamily N-acetyltransferase
MTNQPRKPWQTIIEALRYRGLFFSSSLALREILRPFMYWHAWHIFQTDLQQPLPEPYAREPVDVRIYIGRENLEEIAAQISSMGNIPLADIKFRFGRGDAAAVAYVQREAAGFMWMAFADGAELAFGVNWILHANEALRYDSFVVPPWRGLGIHSAMNRALTEYARDRGLTRAISAISAVNPQSLNLAKHNRNPKVMTVILIHFRGVKWTYTKTIGAPFDSRFSRSSKDLYRARKSVGGEF